MNEMRGPRGKGSSSVAALRFGTPRTRNRGGKARGRRITIQADEKACESISIVVAFAHRGAPRRARPLGVRFAMLAGLYERLNDSSEGAMRVVFLAAAGVGAG